MSVAISHLPARQRIKKPAVRVQRRVAWIWALLFLNVLSFQKLPIVVPVPHRIAQTLTQGALVAAFVLALTINPRVKLRPSVLLGLYSLLAIMSLVMSIRFVGIGYVYRALRLIGFLAVLWMLTPWWGQRDLILLRSQIRVLMIILGTAVLGLVVSPRKALDQFSPRRLADVIWPIPPTQLAHYCAELTGLVVLLWMCRLVTRRYAIPVIVVGVAALLATETRTALVAMVAGLLVAWLSLFKAQRNVRRALIVTAAIVIVVVPLSPLLNTWLSRGQSGAELSNLSGRTKVWPLVLSEPRPETNKILGSGLSNGSVVGQPDQPGRGLPIDSSWIATYQDQGLVGCMLEGTMFIVLLVAAFFRPRGPTRAVALFLIIYCLVASFTETGLGEASPYLLDLTLAASLLVPAWGRQRPVPQGAALS